jgi:hypothetical protein
LALARRLLSYLSMQHQLALAVFALGACTVKQPGTTGAGEIKQLVMTGGLCQASQPWCGFTVTFTGADVAITSASATGGAAGTLTVTAQAELADLIASIPSTTPLDLTTQGDRSGDGGTASLSIHFDDGAVRTYTYGGSRGDLQALAAVIDNIDTALIQCATNARVTLTGCD